MKKFGDFYVQIVEYIKQFFAKTAFPAVTSDWKDASKDWRGGLGWTWEGVAAKVLKDFFYLAAYNQTHREYFMSNIFFALKQSLIRY